MVAAGLGTGRSFVGAGRASPPPPARRGEDAVHGRRSKEKEGRGRPWLHTRTQRRVREGGIKQKLGFLLSDFGRGVGVHWLHPGEGCRGDGSNYTVAQRACMCVAPMCVLYWNQDLACGKRRLWQS